MSDPSTITSIATTIDPLEVLPNELFLQIFGHLYQLDICAASSTNSKWRSILISSPELYSTLHLLLRDGYLDRPSQVQEVKANSQIKSLIKASQLSQNRIKELRLDAGCLVLGQFETVWSNWEASRFSTLIDVLSLSKEHLKTVEINLPMLDLDRDSVTLSHSCQMVCNILYGLRVFDNLKRIKLTASTLLSLRSQSDDRVLIVQDNYEDETNSQSSMAHITLLAGVCGLLGDHLTEVKTRLSGEIGIDLTIVRLLEKSKVTLKEIDLWAGNLEDCNREMIEFITDCPNLVSLKVGFPASSSSEETRPRFSIPPTFKHLSKLEHLVITGDVDFAWEDQSLYVWFGKRLITLKIDFYIRWQQERFLNQTQIDRQLFSSFFRPLSSTLTTLDLAVLMLEAPRSQQDSSSGEKLEMEALSSIEVRGNMDLINFILNIKCPNLRELILLPFELAGHQLQELDDEALKEFLKNSSATLVELQIGPPLVERGRQPSTPRIFSQFASVSRQYVETNPIVFEKLEVLEIELDGIQIVECFAFHHYPKLELTSLFSNGRLEPIFEKWSDKNEWKRSKEQEKSGDSQARAS